MWLDYLDGEQIKIERPKHSSRNDCKIIYKILSSYVYIHISINYYICIHNYLSDDLGQCSYHSHRYMGMCVGCMQH